MKTYDGKKVVIVPSVVTDKKRTRLSLLVDRTGIPRDAEVVAGYLVENNRKKVMEEKEKNPNKRRRAAVIGAILLTGAIGLNLITDTEITTEHVSAPINGMYYMVDNPTIASWGLVNSAAQETMTNKFYSKDGADYYPVEQARREQGSIDEHDRFINLQITIHQNMAILKNSASTQEELVSAVKAIKEATDQIHIIYGHKKGLVQEASEDFEKQAKVMPDSRTDGEIEVKDAIVDEFDINFGISEANIDFINQICERIDAGEEVHFDMIAQALDGDYLIAGTSSHDVVQERKYRGISAILHHFSKYFSRTKTNDQQTQNTEEQTQEDSEVR